MYNLYLENRFSVGSVAVAPEAVRRAGGWDPNPDLAAEDWGFWLNLLATAKGHTYDESRYVSAYRQHLGQASAASDIEEAWRQDGYYLRRQLLERHMGSAALRAVRSQGSKLFTDEYLGPGSQEFIRSLEAKKSKVADISVARAVRHHGRPPRDNHNQYLTNNM